MRAAFVVRPWWVLAVRGLAAACFALSTVALAPGSLPGLVVSFALYALFEGVALLIVARAQRQSERRFACQLVEGVVGVAAGVIALSAIGMEARSFTALISSWAIARGAAALVEVVLAARGLAPRDWPAPVGLASLLFGLLLLVAPGEGGLGGVMWIGAYALASGAALVALAVRTPISGRRQPNLVFVVPKASAIARAATIRWRTRARLQAPR